MNKFRQRKWSMLLLQAVLLVFGSVVYAQEALPESPPSLRSPIPKTENGSKGPALPGKGKKEPAKVVLPKCQKPKGRFMFNFEKAKLSDLVEAITRLQCDKNFILSGAVKGTQEVSILSRSPVTLNQAWQAFLSALEVNGLAVIKVGRFHKIIQRTDVSKSPGALVADPNEVVNNEGVVTFLYDIKNLPKESAQSLVKSLLSRTGDVIAAGDGYLIITDSGANITRVVRILEKVDVVGASTKIRVVDMIYADAQQVQQKLMDIFDARSMGRAASPAARAARMRSGADFDEGSSGESGFSLQKIIADERTNKLIIIASEKAFERMKEVIDMLDKPPSDASSQTQVYVYYLRNGDAKKMAATLSTVIQGSGMNRGRMPQRPMGPGEGLFESDVKITADESTNSLVLVASPKDYKSILKVIQKLDKFRTQVYVEAVIMEVAKVSSQDLGLNLFGGKEVDVFGESGKLILANPGGKSLISGVTSKDSLQALASLPENLRNVAAMASFVNVVGFVGPNFKDSPIPSFGAMLNAIKTNNNVDILSTPSLMALDNEKAEMSSGEKIPVLKGASTLGVGGGSGLVPFQNVEHLDVKLKFAITPHVSEDGKKVRLDIEQEVNELGGEEVLLNQKQFRIRTRTVKTTVIAQDQETVVITGLMSQGKSASESKVPILGDIPIIGWAFKNTSKREDKKNLLIAMTPHVIREEGDYKKIYDRKMQEREEFTRLNLGTKPQVYDPAIDYSKKKGPLQFTVEFVENEMLRAENGGPGEAGETLIMPNSSKEPEGSLQGEGEIGTTPPEEAQPVPEEQLQEEVPPQEQEVPAEEEPASGERPPVEEPASEEIPPAEESQVEPSLPAPTPGRAEEAPAQEVTPLQQGAQQQEEVLSEPTATGGAVEQPLSDKQVSDLGRELASGAIGPSEQDILGEDG